MVNVNNPLYATIGQRLSMLLLSPNSYGGSSGTAHLDMAYNDFFMVGNVSGNEFRFERIPTEQVDFIDGPNIVVGYSDDGKGFFDHPVLAFIYDDLDSRNDSSNSGTLKSYQARVILEETLTSDDFELVDFTLRHALQLLSLRANLHSIIHRDGPSIVLGLHENVMSRFPQLAETMVDTGFKHHIQNLNGDELRIYRKRLGVIPSDA